MTDIRAILDDIRIERRRQDEKWGDQSGHPDSLMLAILMEEVGEAASAVIHLADDRAHMHRNVGPLRTELIQVAAVAVQWVEHLDAGGQS